MNYLELMSDDLPAFVVQDWIDVLNAEVEASPDTTKPTQDLLAQERQLEEIRATQAETREIIDGVLEKQRQQ